MLIIYHDNVKDGNHNDENSDDMVIVMQIWLYYADGTDDHHGMMILMIMVQIWDSMVTLMMRFLVIVTTMLHIDNEYSSTAYIKWIWGHWW